MPGAKCFHVWHVKEAGLKRSEKRIFYDGPNRLQIFFLRRSFRRQLSIDLACSSPQILPQARDIQQQLQAWALLLMVDYDAFYADTVPILPTTTTHSASTTTAPAPRI